MPDSTPTTMSVSFLHPVFDALVEKGFPEPDMARQLALTEIQSRDPSTQVASGMVYSFLAWAADQAGDPCFAANCGRRMGRGHWAPVLTLFDASRTVADFLLKFSAMAAGQSRSAAYRLEVEGEAAMWKLTRPEAALPDCAHADAMAVGFFCEILATAAGAGWTPAAVVAVTSDGSLIPRALLPSKSIVSGARGMALNFPARWLTLPMPRPDAATLPAPVSLPPRAADSVTGRLRTLMRSNLSDPGRGLADFALALGLKPWRLQSLLAAEGTSVSRLRNDLRRAQALWRLKNTRDTVSVIAADLGYANRANFARAVRSWTGQSPTAFRGNALDRQSAGKQNLSRKRKI